MSDALQSRVNERKIYEEVVNIIVNFVSQEYPDDGDARLRIYSLVAENFNGMVRSLSKPSQSVIIGIEEDGEPEDE